MTADKENFTFKYSQKTEIYNITYNAMENPKKTKLGFLLIGLCSLAHSHEYSGPLINYHHLVYPNSY